MHDPNKDKYENVSAYKIALSTRYSYSVNELSIFAENNDLNGFEYTIRAEDYQSLKKEETVIKNLVDVGLEVRFHLQWRNVELAHKNKDFAEKSLKYYKDCFDLINYYGGKHAVVHLCLGYKEKMHLISYKNAIKYLSEAVNYGAKKNITLCLENLTFGLVDTPENHLDLLKKTGASATVDIGHAKGCPAVLNGKYSAEDFIKTVGNYVQSAHIYDVEKPNSTDGKIMHFAPQNELCMESRVHCLMKTPCDWWLIELGEEQEIKNTAKYLKNIWSNFYGGV